MKVILRSDDEHITQGMVKHVIDALDEEYSDKGLVIKSMTMYVRFQDEEGRSVEPLLDGGEIEREFFFHHDKPGKEG